MSVLGWLIIWLSVPILGLVIGTVITELTKAEIPLIAGLAVMVTGVFVMVIPNVAFAGAALLLAGGGICWGMAGHELLEWTRELKH